MLESRLENVHVLVSDNSSDRRHKDQLESYCSRIDPTVLTYVRPPESFSMADHWQWMIERARSGGSFTHFTILTDRSAYKNGELARILDLATTSPLKVFAFRHQDFVADGATPIRVLFTRYSGQVASVTARELLDRAARVEAPQALPRLLNCVVPEHVLERVAERFGAVIRGTTAPDMGFAFRCLTVVDEVSFLDASPTIHFGQDKSNGYAMSKGRSNEASHTFASELPDDWGSNTYLPELFTPVNGDVHEYVSVAAIVNEPALKPVDLNCYLAANANAVLGFEMNELRRTSLELLIEAGWDPQMVPPQRSASQRLQSLARHPVKKLRHRASAVGAKATCAAVTLPMWKRVARLGWYPRTTAHFKFTTLDDALAYALGARVRKSRNFSL